MNAPILLDIARLLGRAGHATPSGIDRVELAYAQHLAASVPLRLRYVAMDGFGRLRELPRAAADRFIAVLGRHWAGAPPGPDGPAAMARRLWMQAVLRQPAGMGQARWPQPLYLLVSHKHLHRRDRVAAAIRRAGARLAVFVHDLIPIAFPEFARPGQTGLHHDRMQTVAALADAVVVNSSCTAGALAPYLAAAGRAVPVLVAPLGTGVPDVAPAPGAPDYIAIGTIEPRKNHLLLLQIWRRLADTLGPAAPRLALVGRRGWENENVIDHLDRSPAIRGLVTEYPDLPDRQAAALLRGSRALLLPSFAEGYGLPLAEALAAGTPALCSDLPALREVGGPIPEYQQPLDGLGWWQAVLDYMQPSSLRRAAQLRRMAGWKAPCWGGHMAAVLDLLDGLQPAPALDGGRAR